MEQEIKYRGHVIKIEQDSDPMNPIKDWDMLGSFACWHSRYDLCSKDVSTNLHSTAEVKYSFSEPEYFEDFIEENPCFILPLRLYDHSGLTISVGKGAHQCDPGGWDSGQVGWIFVTYEKLKNEYGWKKITPKRLKQVEKSLRSEVEVFDDYLTGNVYGFKVETESGEQTDSCWGFYGDRGVKDAIEEAKGRIDYQVAQSLKDTPLT